MDDYSHHPSKNLKRSGRFEGSMFEDTETFKTSMMHARTSPHPIGQKSRYPCTHMCKKNPKSDPKYGPKIQHSKWTENSNQIHIFGRIWKSKSIPNPIPNTKGLGDHVPPIKGWISPGWNGACQGVPVQPLPLNNNEKHMSRPLLHFSFPFIMGLLVAGIGFWSGI